MSVFAPKGGVGKTTIAFNLAVAIGQLEPADRADRRQPPVRRPALAAQGAGRRAVDPRPADRPDRRVGPRRRPVARPVGHRHPARAAAHRDGRDAHAARRRQGPVAAAPGLRRRSSSTCRATSTTSTSRSSTRATRSSRSSPTTRRRSTTRSRWPTRSGRSATRRRKVRYLVNRADSPGGIDPADLERALGRVPEHRVVSDGMLVVQSNNEGVPFVLANPDAADQPGRHARRRASCSNAGRVAVGTAAGRALSGAMSDPRPIGVFDSGVGGLTVLREIVRRTPGRIDGLPRRQRPRAVRRPTRRRGPGLLDRVARPARRARRQGHRRRLQHVDRGRPRRRSGAATTCRSSASSGPARRPRRWRPATGGSASSPRRRRSGRTPTSGRSRTRTRRSRSTSTRRRRSCRWSRPAS